MNKIDNFEKLEAAIEAYYDNDDDDGDGDGDFYDDKLSQEDSEALKAVVATWGEDELKNGHAVLEDYYSMKIPSQMLKEILLQDVELAYEVYTNGIRDTCQRELIVDATLRYMGLRSWPLNGEGDKVMKDFTADLKEKTSQFGVEVGNIEEL